MQAIDVYVDHPDSSALVVEADHCAQPTGELPRSLATRMTSAGFATLVCRDETHDVARAPNLKTSPPVTQRSRAP